MELRNTKKAFKKVASVMESTMKKMIKSQLNPGTSKFRSGNLERDLRVAAAQDPSKGSWSFFVMFPMYGKYFDSGVAGSNKPTKGRKPSSYKGRPAKPNNKSFYQMGQFKGKSIGTRVQPTKLPFPLKTNIAYFGLTPKPFINPGLEDGIEYATEELGPDMRDQIVKEIKKFRTITVG